MVCVCVCVLCSSFIHSTNKVNVCVCCIVVIGLFFFFFSTFMVESNSETSTSSTPIHPPKKKSPSFSFSISFTIDFYFSTRQNDEYSNCFFLALSAASNIRTLMSLKFFFIYFFSENRLDSALQNVFHDCRWWRWCIDAVCVGVSMMMMEQKLSFKRVLGLIDMT